MTYADKRWLWREASLYRRVSVRGEDSTGGSLMEMTGTNMQASMEPSITQLFKQVSLRFFVDKQSYSSYLSEDMLMLPFTRGLKEPSSLGDLLTTEGPWGCWRPPGHLAPRISWLQSLLLLFCHLFCIVGQKEQEPSGNVCPPRKCRAGWRSHFLTNAHVCHFSIRPVWSTPHSTAAQIKIPQRPWYL